MSNCSDCDAVEGHHPDCPQCPKPETTGRNQDGTFAPGVSGNPAGRPKGSRNKLAEDFFKALADDFAVNGAAAIVSMRTERPGDYAKMIASLQSKEFGADEETTKALAGLGAFAWQKPQ